MPKVKLTKLRRTGTPGRYADEYSTGQDGDGGPIIATITCGTSHWGYRFYIWSVYDGREGFAFTSGHANVNGEKSWKVWEDTHPLTARAACKANLLLYLNARSEVRARDAQLYYIDSLGGHRQ